MESLLVVLVVLNLLLSVGLLVVVLALGVVGGVVGGGLGLLGLGEGGVQVRHVSDLRGQAVAPRGSGAHQDLNARIEP